MQTLNLIEELKSLAPRKPTSHKGDYGHLLVVGGDYGMGGAVRMAAEAALRVGAGLVTVATRPEHVIALNVARPEIMALGVNNGKQLSPLLNKANVVVIGPGLGTSSWGKGLLAAVLTAKKPTLVDADALNLLALKPKKHEFWVLTPHPGEAARLLRSKTQDIQLDRLSAAKKIQQKFGGVAVLKGAGTLIVAPNEKIRVCSAGNPAMASAGMGDVLSGIIGGLLVQGLTLFDAAKLGVILHAKAGDLVAAKDGAVGMLAMDLLNGLRRVLNSNRY